MTNEKGATVGANGWSVDEAGLPVYRSCDIEAAIDEWRAQTSEANARRLNLGAIAHDVSENKVYGAADFARFVEATGLKKSAVYGYARVHERLRALEISTRVEILLKLDAGTTCFSALKEAAAIENPVEFLRVIESPASTRKQDIAKALSDQYNAAIEKEEEIKIAAWVPRPGASQPGEVTATKALGTPPAVETVEQSPPRPATANPREQSSADDSATPPVRCPQPHGTPESTPTARGGILVVRDGGASLNPGSNRGDCVELAELLAPRCVSAIICDPPYGIGDTGGRGRGSQGRIKNDENPRAAAKAVRAMLGAVEHTLADDAAALFFCSPKSKITAIMMRAIERSGYLKPSPIPLIWYKGPGRWCQKSEGARRTYEAIIYAQKGTPKMRPSEGGDVISCRPDHARKRRHHHQKPRGLMAKLVQDYVPEGGLVLDPFSGSGSTLDAADLLGRRAVGFEIDERFHGRAERQLDRVRRAPDELRKHWLDQALQKVFVEPRGLSTLPAEPSRYDDVLLKALPERISSRVRPLFDDLDSLFEDVPPPPPNSPYAMLSEAIRNSGRFGAA
ncbi:MAG: hypothetical protein M3R38_03960 [Actinomycetota bacterium]|nr:hypothetical protein [Actinomycetota bacterium]